MATIHCVNPDCPEHAKPKDMADVYAPELAAGRITCGGCGEVILPDTLNPSGSVA